MTAMADGMRRALQSIARDNNSRRLVFEGNLLRDIASRPRLERVVSSTISVRHHIPSTPESVARRGSANNTRLCWRRCSTACFHGSGLTFRSCLSDCPVL